MIRERLTKLWETKTSEKRETPWKKLTQKPTLLEQIPPPGHPEFEKERLASWLRLPRRARVAIRRLHRTVRHLQKEALVQILRAARTHKITSTQPRPFDARDALTRGRSLKHKVSPPRPYTFNHKVAVDVFEIVDSLGTRFSILNAVCMETTYHQAWFVRESENFVSPSSHACLRAFVHSWTRWAGWPKLVRCDRGDTQQRRIWLHSCQERCGNQTCWTGSS